MRTFRLALCCLLVACACTNPSGPMPEASSAPKAGGRAGVQADSDTSPGAGGGKHEPTTPNAEVTRMHITVGSTVFAATLSDNASARAFAALLPLTLNMTDVN